jgi:hypothetical protein
LNIQSCEFTPGQDISEIHDQLTHVTHKPEENFDGPFLAQTSATRTSHSMPISDQPLVDQHLHNGKKRRLQIDANMQGDGWGDVKADESFPPPPGVDVGNRTQFLV